MPEIVTRQITFRAEDATGDMIPCTVSSEEPVDRGGFVEILSHEPGHIDLRRAPLPLIVQHDHHQLNIGVVENLRLEGRKLKGDARFGSSELAQQIFKDAKGGIVRSLSVGYQLLDTVKKAGRAETFSWQPYEVSVVSVPADTQAGFYRSHSSSKGKTMPDITIEPNDHQSRSQRRSSGHAALEERERVQEITALANQFGMQNEANRAINEGISLDEFRAVVLSRQRASTMLRPAESPDIGMSRREVEQFSFVKAIMAQMDPNFARREAGFELEASRAVADRVGKQPQGIFVPGEVLRYQRNQTRDLIVGSAAAGGNLVATDLLADSFITLLRNRSHVINMGATTLGGLVGNVAIPSQTGAGTAFWITESGAPTESQQVFGQVPLAPKTVGAYTDFSRRMLLQATPDIESIVRADLAAIMAVEIDRVAIAGTGASNEPTGILGTSGIGAVPIGTDGGAITWTHVLQLEEAIATANADMGSLGYMTNNKVRRALKAATKVSGDAGAGFIWSDESRDADGYGTLNGYRAAASNNVPSNLTKGTGTNLSAMIYANWEDLLIGQWGPGIDILVDKFTNGTSGGTRVVALLDVDIAIRRAASFAAIVDATT